MVCSTVVPEPQQDVAGQDALSDVVVECSLRPVCSSRPSGLREVTHVWLAKYTIYSSTFQESPLHLSMQSSPVGSSQ